MAGPMIRSPNLVRLAVIALTGALAACTLPGPAAEVDLTEMVRVEPRDFQLQTSVPRGLSDTGLAWFDWVVIDATPEGDAAESFELKPDARAAEGEDGIARTVFVLQPADYARFQRQQVLQRAQLLAGYYGYAMRAGPDLCDVAGIQVKGGRVTSLLSSAAGPKIGTLPLKPSATELERGAPFCI